MRSQFTNYDLLFLANGEEECPKTYNLIGCYVEYIPGALLFSDRDKFKWGNLEQQLKE